MGRIDAVVVAMLVPWAALTALVFLAPATLPPGATGDLSGVVGTIDNTDIWSAFPEPQQWIYRVGDVACHTKASRSFLINDNQMPFCARDVAIFAGVVAGLALCVSPRFRAYRAAVMLPWWSYFALLLPMGLDGGAQDFLGFESDNLRRVLTGFPAGLAVAFALVFIAYEGHFAAARWRGRARRGRDGPAATERRAPQSAELAEESGETGSWGSKAVESAPTEKKNVLAP